MSKQKPPVVSSPEPAPVQGPVPNVETVPIVEKVPAGYRPLTKEEDGELLRVVNEIMFLQERGGRIAAQMELLARDQQGVRSRIAALDAQVVTLNKSLGIKVHGDLVIEKATGKSFVRTGKAAKVKPEPLPKCEITVKPGPG
jgi:hypothetical protein